MHFSSKPGVCAQLPAQAPHLEVTSDVFHTHQHQMHLSDQPCEKWHTAASKTAEQLLLQQQQLHTDCVRCSFWIALPCFPMRQAVLAAPEAAGSYRQQLKLQERSDGCSVISFRSRNHRCSRFTPGYRVQMPASSQAIHEGINCKICKVSPRWNKPGVFFCSLQCTKEFKTVHAKITLLYEKSILSHKNTEPKTQIPKSVKSFMASIIPIKPSLNISSSCKMM